MSLTHDLQVTGDGPGRDEEDAIGEVFGGEQGPLTEGLLAKVEEPRLPKGGGAMLKNQKVIGVTSMESEGDGLLLGIGPRACRRVRRRRRP